MKILLPSVGLKGLADFNYPSLHAGEVACCYIFIRSNDGMKALDSVNVEVNSSFLNESGGVKSVNGGVKSGSILTTGGVNSPEQQIMQPVLLLPVARNEGLVVNRLERYKNTNQFLRLETKDQLPPIYRA